MAHISKIWLPQLRDGFIVADRRPASFASGVGFGGLSVDASM